MSSDLPAATRPFDHMSFFVAQLLGGLLLVELFVMGGMWGRLAPEYGVDIAVWTQVLIDAWPRVVVAVFLTAVLAKEWLVADRTRRQQLDLVAVALLLAGHAGVFAAFAISCMTYLRQIGVTSGG